MAKSYKLKGDNYIDSSSVVHNRTQLKTILNNLLDDTGWVDLSNYVNTQYFTVRPGYPPKARKKGGIVYWQGEVYCSTNVNDKVAILLSNIPTNFIPHQQHSNTCTPYMTSTSYNIYIENLNSVGRIRVSSSNNLTTQSTVGGFQLSNLSGYLAV